ncbi:MAG: hypothetical protein HUU35_10080 [Armatimonadetes bacterium]|nr:hypothetical protein [Armatimonadota bacterium]
MDIAVNPALVIALGGTGQNIVNRLRRRIRQRVGTDQLPLVEYLYLDTDKGNRNSSEETGEGIPIGLSPQVAAELADLRSPAAMELDLSSWISEDALDRLHRGTLGGAQGFRQLGHVSFLASQKLRELNNQIKERVGNLLEARRELLHKRLPHLNPPYLQARLQGAGPKVSIYVLASAGGGTGSSTLIDMGYFIRRALREGAYETDCVTIGVVCLATTTFDESHQYRYNSAGVLTELNHYLRKPSYRAAYPMAFPGDRLSPDLPSSDRMFGIASRLPYDYQYVVQPATMTGGLLDPDDPPRAMARLEQRVAELILSDTVYAAAPGAMEYDTSAQPPTPPEVVSRVLKGELEARRVDFAGRARRIEYDGRYPTDLMTFGISTREFPAAMHHVLAFGQAVRSLAARWASIPAPGPGAADDDLGHALANARLHDWIQKLSLLPDVREYAQQRPRNAAKDELLAALVTVPEVDVRQQLQAHATQRPAEGQQVDTAQWLLGRRGAVDQLLVQVADTPPLGQPGSLYARLRDRRQELAGWTEAGYAHQLARDLLNLAFDAEAGAGVSLALADRLNERLTQELNWVQQCLADSAPPASAAVPQAPSQRDWLLFGWHATTAAPPDTSGVEIEAWNHANQRLLRLVLEGKAAVLQSCLGAVGRMRQRLANLRVYFEKWESRAPDPADPSFQLSAEEQQYVLREDALIERFAQLDGLGERLQQALQRTSLYRALGEAIARGLPEADAQGEPALLVEGLPLDRRRNQPDFKPLEDIEAAVFEAIGSRRDGPYRQEVIDLLERRAAAEGTALPELQREASPLLQFSTDNPGYAMDCKFGGDAELWQFLSAHDSLNHANFETLVNRQQAACRFPDTPETKMVSVDTMIPSVVTISRHRIGVVTPLINGYDAGTVRRMLREAKHPPLTDVRIRPPLDPDLLWQAGFKLLGGLVLGNGQVFTVDDNRFRFDYTIRDAAGYTRTQSVKLSMSFAEAHDTLARNDLELAELDGQIRLKVYELQDGVSERIEEMIRLLDRHRQEQTTDYQSRRLDVWQRGGQASGIYLSDLNYDDAFNLLTSFALEYQIRCNLEVRHAYVEFKRMGDEIRGGKAQIEGWYCRFCGHFHGQSVPAGNRTCAACRNLVPAG